MSALTLDTFSPVPVVPAAGTPSQVEVKYRPGCTTYTGSHFCAEIFNEVGNSRALTRVLLHRYSSDGSSSEVSLCLEPKSPRLLTDVEINPLYQAARLCFFDLRAGVDAFIQAAEDLDLNISFVSQGQETAKGVPLDVAKYRESILTNLLPALDELKDNLTGAATKYTLLSEKKLAEMYQRPGQHFLAFIDFAHMSVGNDVGLRKEVNALLGRALTLAKECFASIDPNFDFVRAGGDEFAIHFAVQGEGAKERLATALKSYKEKLAAAKREIFGDPNELIHSDANKALSILEGEHYAAIRHESRILRAEYEEGERAAGRTPRLQTTAGLVQFGAWIVRNYGQGIPAELRATLENLGQGFFDSAAMASSVLVQLPRPDLENAVAKLENLVGRAKVGDSGSIQFMFPRVAVVDLSTDCSDRIEAEDVGLTRSLTMSLALGKADKLVHQIQRNVIPEDFLPQQITPDIKLKPDEASEIRALNMRVKQAQAVVAKLRDPALDSLGRAAYLSDGIRLLTSDPSVEDTPRLSLVSYLQACALLPVGREETRSFSIFRFDLPGAGAVNNHSSYRDLDRIVTELAKEARKLFPEALVLRVDGGSLYLFVPGKADLQIINELRARMNQDLAKKAEQLPFARLEFNQKQVLRDMVHEGQKKALALGAAVSPAEPKYFRRFSADAIKKVRFMEMSVDGAEIEIAGNEQFVEILERWRQAIAASALK